MNPPEGKVTIGNVCFLQDTANRRILFLKRNREPMKNLCTGVGGKTDFFEDPRSSCIREIKEETGLVALGLECRGVLKTILDGKNSSWILFVYVCDQFDGSMIPCDEGELFWVPYDQISTLQLIGFIELILPRILAKEVFVEGTIWHDLEGKVLESKISTTEAIANSFSC